MKQQLKEEITALFDTGDTRSFSEIYSGKEDLFENVDDMIDPRMRKLFESVYVTNKPTKRLREDFDHNFTGDEPGPSGDGVCDGHNKPGLSGEDPCATQGQGRGNSNNAKLFNESRKRRAYALREASKATAANQFIESIDALKEISDEILQQIPLQQKKLMKQAKESGMTLDSILKDMFEKLGVENMSDVGSLSQVESMAIVVTLVSWGAINDDWDEVEKILSQGKNALKESRMRESFFKDEDYDIMGKYTDNKQNQKLGRVGQEYVKGHHHEPSTIKKIGQKAASIGKLILGTLIGGAAGVIPGVANLIYGTIKSNIIGEGLNKVSGMVSDGTASSLVDAGAKTVTEIAPKLVYFDSLVMIVVGGVLGLGLGAAFGKLWMDESMENEFRKIYMSSLKEGHYSSASRKRRYEEGDAVRVFGEKGEITSVVRDGNDYYYEFVPYSEMEDWEEGYYRAESCEESDIEPLNESLRSKAKRIKESKKFNILAHGAMEDVSIRIMELLEAPEDEIGDELYDSLMASFADNADKGHLANVQDVIRIGAKTSADILGLDEEEIMNTLSNYYGDDESFTMDTDDLVREVHNGRFKGTYKELEAFHSGIKYPAPFVGRDD